jgi:UDP-glucose 4-epimerase
MAEASAAAGRPVAAARAARPARPERGERRSPVRLQRARVLVTGASSSLGRVLCQHLHRSFDVLSLDQRPFADRPKDVEHHELDLRRKAAQTLIKKRRPDFIVHLGPIHDEGRRVRGASQLEALAALLKIVEDTGTKKLVLLSSAMLYGPSPSSASFMSEDAPLLGGRRPGSIADGIAIDMMVQSFFWKRPETETVILRPVHVIGPHLQNVVSRYLRGPRVPTLLGFDPMMQLVHEDDVVQAVRAALAPGVRGVFNICGPTQAPLSRLIEARGASSLPLPLPLLTAALGRARALRLTRIEESDLLHLKYACLVDGRRAAEQLGYLPRHGIAESVRSL